MTHLPGAGPRALWRFVLIVVLACAAAANAQEYSRVVAFGDSWTDPDQGDPDGPSHAYDLAGLLGIPISNYAVGGATTGEINGQISAYLASGNGVDPDALHLYWAVGNDFTEPGAPSDPDVVVASMVANADSGLADLQQAGAQHFVIFHFIDNALRPISINSGMQAEATAISINYNNSLDTMLQNRNLLESRFDSFTFFSELVQDPRFVNITQGCEQVNCSNPDAFVWWDEIHPSSESHRLIADGVYDWLAASAVMTAPRIISTAPLSATVGTDYTYDVDATDDDPGDVVTYAIDSGPAAMSIDAATGIVGWTPVASDAGTQPVTVSATDSDGLSDSQSFNITVTDPSSGGGGGTGGGGPSTGNTGGGGAVTWLLLLAFVRAARHGRLPHPI